MMYIVTLSALQAGLGGVAVTVHRVEGGGVAAVRTVRDEPRADGFRVINLDGRLMLDYVDRPGRS